MNAKDRLTEATNKVSSLTQSVVTLARITGVTVKDLAEGIVDADEAQSDYMADLTVAMVKSMKNAEKAEDEKESKRKK